ncbi:Epimerase family protein SDR39U1-like Protein [Tribolium castaneum]|uniref:Epimerase family protein SDR39U1-like Protein n=1 Tax=Tribolium castaneum TaxID=7070 RepID=D6WDT7_TRICA|nr:PREDICTED: epimerase family protein SDR39U1 [Tribolium castaneum]XP_008191160.1 PREDICTED: epimerase family protein SDR39U1 [Tribolium castaneum]XP_008191161.1 PREDICTED: epimerase family protein SDR39U1 [Tribolium castaneum]XP_015833638.1 PREDICTED: epimerase family protein SDR39U1 [Tribolium castaneum]EFA00825.1 Epimerase family protein SDR39U1-like Protein [Tribolium castaneum]|eukprot:XP_001807381.1 PREDICTED: epimerase family protein SDR39U1 [Tribolium castaneum]
MSKALGTALVGGGTGFIGSHLCNALKSQGYGVTVISRMPGPQRMTWNDLNRVGLPEGTTAVINLAGQNVLDMKQRWNAGFKQNVFNSRVNTTSSLAKAISNAQNKPSVFVSISGVGIYKADKVREYDEASVEPEFDFFSRLCHEWEKAAKLPKGPTRQVTIRSGVVLGRNGGMIKQLYLPFFCGLGGPVMPGDQYLPWIHIEDLTGLILFALKNDKVEGTLNGVAPQNVTNKEFSDAFAKALRRPAFFPVPKFVLNVLLSEERANMLTEGQKVLPKRTMSLGFQYKYPDIASACQQVVTKE